MIVIDLKKDLMGTEGTFTLNFQQEIPEKSFIAIFGKSGVGKTTLLRILAGLDSPDSGTIKIGNTVWFDSQKRINITPQKRKLGFVFQNLALFPNMTVRQNLEFADDKNDQKYIYELLNIMNLTEITDRKPETLSGGQKQRVALARALVRKPEILLLDEPLSALDREMRIKLQTELQKIHRELGITIFIVTHDVGEVFKLANQVYIIENGIVIKQGEPGRVFLEQKISGKFKFTGEIIDIKKSDVVYIITVLIGNNFVKVIATEEEIMNLKIGDRVLVASKAFNPIILKI